MQAASHIEHYAKHQRNPSDLIIPIGGDALYYVDKNNWQVCSIGELFSEADYGVAFNETQLALDRLIDRLNDYSKKFNPSIGLEIGKYYALQLWIILGQIHYNSFICKSILNKLNPSKILVYTKNKPSYFMELRPDPDCIFSEVLIKSGFIEGHKIELIKLSDTNKVYSLRERIANIVPAKGLAYIREIRDWIKVFSPHKSPYRLLMIGGGYDWFKVSRCQGFRELFKLNIATKPIKKELVGIPPRELLNILNNAVNNSFSMNELSLKIYSDLTFFSKNYEKFRKKLCRYDAFVTGALTYPWDNFLAHISAKINKPLIVWQHGEKGQAENMASLYSELYYATDYLTYGPTVKQFYKKWIGKNRLIDIQVVGSLAKSVVHKNELSIVYATGKWFKTAAPFMLTIDPDKRLFNAHNKILPYLDLIGLKRKVIFKANNTSGFNSTPYEYKNIIIDRKTPFSKLLETASIVILDTPATTLIEACSTTVPIFVLGGRDNYFPDFLQMVARRVVWCETPDALVHKLNMYITEGIYEADIRDETYLQGYGSNLSRNEVEQRVMSAVFKTIKRSGQSII
uniref:hypothetical protein n=1 Tax=Polynucleobacter sp. TaxID=2029855 RepID=UPI0040478DA1